MADNLIQMQHSTKESAGFSHDGKSFDSDDNGVITLPSHFADHAKAHGFTVVKDKGPKKLEPLAKSAKGGDKEAAPDESIGDTSETVIGGDEVKRAQKGAKSAKGGE